jgi:UDP-N-acetylglucosamine--N-acetylmuramyl-(pentapeptide) pyrophosphoryl-undecaprenol N-acetylglucosamine transferase
MHMVVAGGGTGGHLFPGLAVAEAIAAMPGADVRFVGSAFGIESTAVPRAGFPFTPLVIRGVRGRGVRGALAFCWQLPFACVRAWRLLGAMRPDLVLGLGGYGSVPVVLAARVRRVPSVLLEQNAHPGMANRLLAHLARRVCTTFAESASFFPTGKCVHTGNPVRRLSSPLEPLARHFTIFVFGGSQGARTINRAAVGAATILREQVPNIRLIHQTGTADVEWVREGYRTAMVEAEVHPFIHDMARAYARADLVVCRAGATTLAELAMLGKPAILVPYPFAADDHQRANAEVLVRRGAARMVLDGDLSDESLAQHIGELAGARDRLQAMAACARALAVPEATARVVEVCQRTIEGEKTA